MTDSGHSDQTPCIIANVDKLNRYRPWFYAAAAYNAIWGGFVMLWPTALFEWLKIPAPNPATWFQCIGMMVGVYAIGYWLIARDPARFGPFVYVGLAGKILGPIGFLVAANKGDLPWAFGWINVFNDLIWLPAFICFAIQLQRVESAPNKPE